MNSSPSHYDRTTDERAATWAARLDGDVLEASERSALDAWLAESPAHRAALSEYCQLSADLEERLPKLVAAGAVAMPTQKKRRIWSFPSVAGLALAAAAAVALVVWAARPAPQVQNFVTAMAERANYTLADGTRVEMNAHTSLRFENGKTERHVRLAGGEALFIVTKDKSRPFTVETPTGSVRVTGTTFNVRSDSAIAAFDVTVVEGSVQVRPSQAAGGSGAGAITPLAGGEHLSAHAGVVTKKTLSASALSDELLWREGKVVFVNVPLAEAAARFAHYHGRIITVDPLVAKEPIMGIHSLEDLDGFFNFINSALPAKVNYDPNGAASIVPQPSVGSETSSQAKP
jgi:transmembrane sensor